MHEIELKNQWARCGTLRCLLTCQQWAVLVLVFNVLVVLCALLFDMPPPFGLSFHNMGILSSTNYIHITQTFHGWGRNVDDGPLCCVAL